MLGLILRIVLMFLTLRFVGGLLRAISGGDSRPSDQEQGAQGPKAPPKPLVDRASAIDVPFTEERKEP